MEILEPFPYGDFPTLEKLYLTVEERRKQNKQLYGHAIIYPENEQGTPIDRIGARVSLNGDIMVGAHCEWI